MEEIIEIPKTKVCTECGEEKLLSEFWKRKDTKDGFNNSCKKCKNEYYKQYYKENKENIKQRIKQWYEENKEYIKQYSKQWREENKEYIKQYNKQYYKQWYEENKEYIKQYSKQWREENKEYNKQYYKENKENIKQRTKQYREQNRITVNNEIYFINTAPEELQPTLKNLIKLRKLKQELNNNKKEVINLLEVSNG